MLSDGLGLAARRHQMQGKRLRALKAAPLIGDVEQGGQLPRRHAEEFGELV